MQYLLSPGFFLFLVALTGTSEKGLTLALVAIRSGLLNDTTKNMQTLIATQIVHKNNQTSKKRNKQRCEVETLFV